MPGLDPLTPSQAHHLGAVKPPCSLEVDVLDRGPLAEMGLAKAGAETTVLALGHFPVDEQAQAFFEAQRFDL